MDFFNHDTKYTDVTTGFKPQLDTIFSFKNTVDNFYLSHLKNESILLEVFTVKAGGSRTSERIGQARLPLAAVLGNELGFQAAPLTCVTPALKGLSLGQVFFRTRMRKPLDEAWKWFQKNIEVTEKQGD